MRVKNGKHIITRAPFRHQVYSPEEACHITYLKNKNEPVIHIHSTNKRTNESSLFTLTTTPHAVGKSGGLGWHQRMARRYRDGGQWAEGASSHMAGLPQLLAIRPRSPSSSRSLSAQIPRSPPPPAPWLQALVRDPGLRRTPSPSLPLSVRFLPCSGQPLGPCLTSMETRQPCMAEKP